MVCINIPGGKQFNFKSDLEIMDEVEFERQVNEANVNSNMNNKQEENEYPGNETVAIEDTNKINVSQLELLRIKAGFKAFKKLLNAQQIMISKEILKEIIETYEIDKQQLLWMMTFGENGFNVK